MLMMNPLLPKESVTNTTHVRGLLQGSFQYADGAD